MKMKIGDEIYVHGYVNEIRGDCVIVENKGGCFGTRMSEVSSVTEFPWSQLVYPADKFSVVVHDNKIHLINKNEVELKVTAEQKPQTDCGWK